MGKLGLPAWSAQRARAFTVALTAAAFMIGCKASRHEPVSQDGPDRPNGIGQARDGATDASEAASDAGANGGAQSGDAGSCLLGTVLDCSDRECSRTCNATPDVCRQFCCIERPVTGITCGSSCLDPLNDAANCGGCGNACGANEACYMGECIRDCGDPTPELSSACDALCGELGPSCGIAYFPWPNLYGQGRAVHWVDAEACRGECISGSFGCSSARAQLVACWQDHLTCAPCSPETCGLSATGAAQFAACERENAELARCLREECDL